MTIPEAIVACLSDDLRRPPYKGDPNPLAGHCYVASEALYHLWAGLGLKPMFVRHEGQPHWFLKDELKDKVIDLTAGQFRTPVPYGMAVGKGFLTTEPSLRAKELMRRVHAAIEREDFETDLFIAAVSGPYYGDGERI